MEATHLAVYHVYSEQAHNEPTTQYDITGLWLDYRPLGKNLTCSVGPRKQGFENPLLSIGLQNANERPDGL